MTAPQVGERWVFPPGQTKTHPAKRTGYLLRVPTYFETAAFRDWFMREHGPIPSEIEILNELRLALPDVEPDEGKRGDLDQLVSAATAAFLIPGSGSAEGRAKVDALKRRAMAANRTFRGYMADTMTRENLYPLELIRWFCRGWQGVVDAENGKAAELTFVDLYSGEPVEGGAGEGRMMARSSLEFMPPGHIPWTANEIETLSGPKGTTAKNWQSRSSTPSTPTTSTTAASGPRTTRPRKPRHGSSRTSK
jgi:hypothetical protein